MMRILVLSDTHRNVHTIVSLLKDISAKIDMIIHLGDNIEDAEFIKKQWGDIPIYYIQGNCDSSSKIPDEAVIHLKCGKKIFITHGHLYNVYGNLDGLAYRALEYDADICLFGHTHIPYIEKIGKVVVMNPGSLSIPRGNSKKSYGIIKIDEDNKIYPSIVEWRK